MDVCSKPNRYESMFDAIKRNISPNGTLVEMGCAAADNLMALNDHFERKIGINTKSLEEIVEDPMMFDYRWEREAAKTGKTPAETIAEHLDAVKKSSIEYVQGNMFEKGLFEKLLLQKLPSPIVLLFANSLFPHYNSEKVCEGLNVALSMKPDYIVIGGRVLSIEYFDPMSNEYSSKIPFHIWEIKSGAPKLLEIVWC